MLPQCGIYVNRKDLFARMALITVITVGKDEEELGDSAWLKDGIERTTSKAIQIQRYVDESQIVKFLSDAFLVL